MSLEEIKEKYKHLLEKELRENQVHGIATIISTVMDAMFREILDEGSRNGGRNRKY